MIYGFVRVSFQPPENMQFAALVIGGSFLIEGTGIFILVLSTVISIFFSSPFSLLMYIFWSGASLIVAIKAVKEGAAAEGMTVRDYVWRGHDPTSVAVMTEVTYCNCF